MLLAAALTSWPPHPSGLAGEVADEPALAPASAFVKPIVGERLSFHGRWFSFPVGHGWIEVKGLVELDGRQAYHIQAEGRSNDVLSTFYPIQYTLISYLDAETLRPLRFEKRQREGSYRADETIVFNYGRGLARYESQLNGSVKEIPITPDIQDLISAFYWFRAQPLEPGSEMQVKLYTDEKIYETRLALGPPTMLELLKRGTFPCFVVEPQAAFKGILVKRGRLWAYFTADRHRLPLLVKITTPWGPMTAVLDESCLPPELARTHAAHPGPDSAHP